MSVPEVVVAVTESDGGGVPIVLGPGLGTTTTLFDQVRPLLAPRHPLFAWDLPGHGASPAPTDGFTAEELATGVLTALDDAGVDRFVVAGNSFAGIVSLAVALAAPERVTAVAMICSLPRLGTEAGWLERAATVRRQGTPVMVSGSAQRWFAPDFIAAQPAIAGRLLDELMTIDDEGYARCCEALAVADLRELMPEVDMPIALIEGAADTVVSLDDARSAVASARHGTLRIVDGAGHQAPVERPSEVAALLHQLAEGRHDDG